MSLCIILISLQVRQLRLERCVSCKGGKASLTPVQAAAAPCHLFWGVTLQCHAQERGSEAIGGVDHYWRGSGVRGVWDVRRCGGSLGQAMPS